MRKPIQYERSNYGIVGDTIQWTSAAGVNLGKIKRIDRGQETAHLEIHSDYYLVEYPTFTPTRGTIMQTSYLNANMMKLLKVVNITPMKLDLVIS